MVPRLLTRFCRSSILVQRLQPLCVVCLANASIFNLEVCVPASTWPVTLEKEKFVRVLLAHVLCGQCDAEVFCSKHQMIREMTASIREMAVVVKRHEGGEA